MGNSGPLTLLATPLVFTPAPSTLSAPLGRRGRRRRRRRRQGKLGAQTLPTRWDYKSAMIVCFMECLLELRVCLCAGVCMHAYIHVAEFRAWSHVPPLQFGATPQDQGATEKVQCSCCNKSTQCSTHLFVIFVSPNMLHCVCVCTGGQKLSPSGHCSLH